MNELGERGGPPRLPTVAEVAKGSTWKRDVVFVAVMVGLFTVLVLYLLPGVLHGQLVGPDSYMRLVRVRRLAESGAWFDNTIPRSNAPFGSTLHWTRPLDVLILVGAWLTQPLLGFPKALHLSGTLVSPLLFIAVCFATAWAVRPLAGARVRGYAMLAVPAQVGFMGYAMPGRADQNMLILLAFVAMQGMTIRLLLEPRPRWSGWATGAWAGFGLWASTEFLVPLFVLLSALVALWVVRGPELAGRARSVSLGLLTMVIVAVISEHPPSALFLVEYDRISIVHVFVMAIVAAFWLLATTERASRMGARGRCVYAVVGAVIALGLVLVVYPRFLGGPMVDVNPELKRTILPLLTEFQPYLVPHGLAGVGRIIAYLGQALLALGVVAHGLRRDRGTPLTSVWVLLGLALVLFIPLGIRWIRFVMYAEMVGVLVTLFLLARVLARLDERHSGARLAAFRAFATAGLIVGPLILGAVVMGLGGEVGGAVDKAASTEIDSCPVDALVAALDDPSGLGARPHTVLAHVDLGSLLLFRTPHSVVGTPYHRNGQGILDWAKIMSTTDPDQALRMIRRRGIDVVVACGADGSVENMAAGGAPSFAARLRSGSVPAWLHAVDLAAAPRGLRIYEVSPEPSGAPPGS